MSDVHAAINEFGKLVGSKNAASSNVFYRWQELRELLDAALAAAGVSGSPDETPLLERALGVVRLAAVNPGMARALHPPEARALLDALAGVGEARPADQYVEALMRVGVPREQAEARVADQRARGLLSEPPAVGEARPAEPQEES